DVEDAALPRIELDLHRVAAAREAELDGEALRQHFRQVHVELATARVAQPAAALPFDDLHAAAAELEPPREVADPVGTEVVDEEHAVARDEVVVGPGALAGPRRLRRAVADHVALLVGQRD